MFVENELDARSRDKNPQEIRILVGEKNVNKQLKYVVFQIMVSATAKIILGKWNVHFR